MRTIRVLASFGSVSADTSATTVGPHECRLAGCPGRFVTGAANPARI